MNKKIIAPQKYILDIAPPAGRMIYMGISNAVVGVVSLLYASGGLIAQQWGLYAIFVVAAVCALPALALFWALKDPESGNLDRVQIIKAFVNNWNRPDEKIYDVAWSDGRVPDPKTGKLPAVGNTVDVATAMYTNDIGDSQLSAVWTDPDFDPAQRAAYYVRVLEIPTPRWSTYDAVRHSLPLPEKLPATIQERAWSSPIWYTPSATDGN